MTFDQIISQEDQDSVLEAQQQLFVLTVIISALVSDIHTFLRARTTTDTQI